MGKNKIKHCGTCYHKTRKGRIVFNKPKWACAITGEDVYINTVACKYHSGGDLWKEGYKLTKQTKNV